MAMTASAMSSYIQGQISKIDNPAQAVSTFYSALCSYVNTNMNVIYSWVAFSTGLYPTPDPVTVINARVNASGSLSPSGASTPADACSMFSLALNSSAMVWPVVWPVGYSLTTAFIIPTITITPSGCTDMNSAWLAVCTQIIAGLKAATPIATGSHGIYVGTASFSSIL